MGKKSIPVKIPIPNNFSGRMNDINTIYGYIEKSVDIASNDDVYKNMCGAYISNSTTCDAFMDTYCTNTKNDYVNLIGGTNNFDSSEWNKYSPECACYGKTLIEIANVKSTADMMKLNYPPKTYMSGCIAGQAYQDKQSRESQNPIINCDAQIILSDIDAGNNVNISDNKIEQNCGASATTSSNVDDTGTSDATKNNTTNNTNTTKDTTNNTNTTKDTTKDTTNKTTNTSTTSSSNMLYYYIGGAGGLLISSMCCVCIIILLLIMIM